MIVKNEAAILSRCLDSVCDLMDEIIIVDTGSTDDTKAVAAKYTDRIYDFAWNNDFSAARNFSFPSQIWIIFTHRMQMRYWTRKIAKDFFC